MNVKILEGQSLFDIAIQTAGSIEAVFALAEKNGISITGELTAASDIVSSEIVNKYIAEYYKAKGLKPATGVNATYDILQEGIEFWEIEYDFIIS